MAYADGLADRNSRLAQKHKEDERIKAEYRKILEIEGLLDLYKDRIGDKGDDKERSLYPHNDYSGLNSLRARLNNKGWDGNPETMPKAMKKRMDTVADNDGNESGVIDPLFTGDSSYDGYLSAMMNGSEYIGAPIYFFFRLGTDELTEVSQLLNIDEIAHINNSLSRKRADYIKTLMVQRGIDEAFVTTSYEGGINEYSPVQANRQTCVTLSF